MARASLSSADMDVMGAARLGARERDVGITTNAARNNSPKP
jgi:hypothetical protein